jgi:CCR4-NOT transcription complex subunit 7/8
MMSGLLFNEAIDWVTFHGQYDFGYLLKVIIGQNLPLNYLDFDMQLRSYFPNKYDIKEIISEKDDLKNHSLQRLGNEYCIERTGQQHQGGSDALLTLGIGLMV